MLLESGLRSEMKFYRLHHWTLQTKNLEEKLERESLFWREIEIDADWVEYYPTLDELGKSADLVGLATFSGLSTHSIFVDESGFATVEVRIDIQIDELIPGGI